MHALVLFDLYQSAHENLNGLASPITKIQHVENGVVWDRRDLFEF